MNQTSKNIFILIISIFVLVSTCNAQFKYAGGKIGYNLSKLNYDPKMIELDFGYRMGINIGLFVEYQLTNLFSIHTELNYSMRGGNYAPNFLLQQPTGKYTEKYTQKLDYLEIPILIQYRFTMDSNPISPKIFIGPEISYLISAKNQYENNYISRVVSERERFKSIEYGLVLGLGMDLNILMNKFTFDARYNFGLNNVSKKTDVNIISNTISINIGCVLKIL